MPKKSAKPSEPQPATLEIIPLDDPKSIEPKSIEPKSIEPKASKPKASKPRAKTTQATTETKAAAAARPKAPAKPRKAKVKVKSDSGALVDSHVPVGEPFPHPAGDPIGDLSDGEAHIPEDPAPASAPATTPESQANAEAAAYRDDTNDSAVDGTLVKHAETESASPGLATDSQDGHPDEEPSAPQPRAPRKLERLQKVLSQAGVASRRRAEELITEGRVQVNGQVVTQLGAKADAAQDHIRVDGKLLSGAERHRYFVLNKPKGFVTTVSDPEGRPTVMEFFLKMRERLYPVGRLDYQSEGLLLVTNDGDLANQLTRAASGVEKTYLVKVAGQPSEAQLDILRSGVAIDREQPGSGTVHTSPARIRQVRRGDNPWFEVVLIEGRNRELRKMFSAIGHFVEKIRRVGYGPLVLDLEPGKLRELEPEELTALRLAAEGKWKPRRSKIPKIPLEDAPPSRPERSQTQRGFQPPSPGARPFRGQSSARYGQGTRPPQGARPTPGFRRDEGAAGRDNSIRRVKPEFKPSEQSFGARPARPYAAKPGFGRPSPNKRSFDKPGFDKPKPGFGKPPGDRPQARPRFERDGADARPAPRFENRSGGFRPQSREAGPRFTGSPRPARPQGGPPGFKTNADAPRRFDKPAARTFSKPRSGEFAARPPARFDKPAGRTFNQPFTRSGDGRSPAKPSARFDKPAGRSFSKPRSERPPDRGFESKPPSGLAIDPIHSSGKPAGKSWSKPGRPARSEGAPSAFRGKPSGGSSRPAAGGGRAKPSFGSKPGFKSGSRPGGQSGSRPGFKRGSPRPGGSRPGGKRG